MDIPVFVKLRVNPELNGPAADTADCGLGRLLHYIPQVACELQLASTLHYVDLYLQHLTANLGPSQAIDHADRVLIQDRRKITADAQVFLQVFLCNANPLYSRCYQLDCRLAAQLPHGPLQGTDTGLSSVAGDDSTDGLVT